MFTFDLKWIVPAVILTSDRLLNSEIELQQGKKINEELPTILKKAIHDYQPYYRHRLRSDDIDYAIEEWLNHDKAIDPISCLDKLADYFLEWTGVSFEVKKPLLNLWLALVSLIDPNWIIASAYKKRIENRILQPNHAIANILSDQCPIALVKPLGNKIYADNHVHLNGHGTSSLSMQSIALYLEKEPENIKWPNRAEFTLYESNKLDKQHLPLLVRVCSILLLQQIFFNTGTKNSKSENKSVNFNIINLKTIIFKKASIIKFYNSANISNTQEIFKIANDPKQCPKNGWLLLCLGFLIHANNNQNCDYRKILSIFIKSSHILRNYMTVSGVGLSQFVSFFGFSLRKPEKIYKSGYKFDDFAVRHDAASNIKREYRISPNALIEENDKRSLSLEYLKRLSSYFFQWSKPENHHFVVHFTRGFPNKKNRNDRLLKDFRDKLNLQVNKLHDLMNSVEYQKSEIKTGTELSPKNAKVDLRKLIRGYDIAGNENQLPIEIFAPTLRVLRSACYQVNSNLYLPFKKPFLTVHAGEDFSHVLSGLRAIDEAVKFCQFDEGDRIGHALALGIDIEQWAKQQKRAYLTVGDHLDNLVWCYHQALKLCGILPEIQPILPILEYKIKHWSNYLYNDEHYSINDLYQAWLLRRNCPRRLNNNQGISEIKRKVRLPDYEFLMNHPESKPKKLWLNYLYSNYPSDNKRRFKTISVDLQIDSNSIPQFINEPLTDSISKEELKLYTAIQDLLIERYSKQGIILEACPTSNLYIGRISHYHEHPLFRWHPPSGKWLKNGERFNLFGIRTGPISVCINTDDCALMPTTIANEHDVMMKTAIKHFDIGHCQAEEWIERIRQKGVDIFDSNHIDWNNIFEPY